MKSLTLAKENHLSSLSLIFLIWKVVMVIILPLHTSEACEH